MILKINTQKVYDSGVYYQKKEEEVKSLKNRLLEVSNDISENYEGPDSHNFLVSFENHINDLEKIELFLDDNSQLLKGNSLDHGTEDNNFIEKVERSEINES